MTIVKLKDNTQFVVDTNNPNVARHVVEHKLSNIGDDRNIDTTKVVRDVIFRKTSKRYNSGVYNDGVPLRVWCGVV